MNIIKVNYNNAYVKVPKTISPYFKCYLGRKNGERYLFLNFVDNLDLEPIYTKYQFDIYVDDVLVTYIDENSNKHYEVTNEVLEDKNSVNVKIKGYYYNEAGLRQDINDLTFTVYAKPVCSRRLVCSENICVESSSSNV